MKLISLSDSNIVPKHQNTEVYTTSIYDIVFTKKLCQNDWRFEEVIGKGIFV